MITYCIIIYIINLILLIMISTKLKKLSNCFYKELNLGKEDVGEEIKFIKYSLIIALILSPISILYSIWVLFMISRNLIWLSKIEYLEDTNSYLVYDNSLKKLFIYTKDTFIPYDKQIKIKLK